MAEEVIKSDPAAVATEEAFLFYVDRDDEFEVTERNHGQLQRLDALAEELGFVDAQYFVDTARGLSIPASFDASEDKRVSFLNFHRLSFEGRFKCYAQVVVGRIVGLQPVQAICLTFDEVTLLPYFDGIPNDHLFYVPVLAVNNMDQTG